MYRYDSQLDTLATVLFCYDSSDSGNVVAIGVNPFMSPDHGTGQREARTNRVRRREEKKGCVAGFQNRNQF